ncbi:MAG: peptidylprolyl isomerase [Spirosomataceae bacterium]
MKYLYVVMMGLFFTPNFAQKKSKKDHLITIFTRYGEMKAILYEQTPLHKTQFLKLTESHFYDSLLFHRIIQGFMIQGGDPNSKRATPNARLGSGGGELEQIPAEFRPELFHKKGVIAAARTNNAEKKSSACQFYIVQGKIHDDASLDAQLKRLEGARMPTATQREVYKTLGGAPHLDGNYTVFGEVISGLSVIDSIASQPRNAADRPLKDIQMQMKVETLKKKKITKRYGYRFD